MSNPSTPGAPTALVVATDAGLVLDFGAVAVGNTKTAALLLEWTCGPLPITAVTISGSDSFAFDLPAADPRTYYQPEDSIRFAPTTIGEARGTLILTAGGRSVAELMLAGTGLPDAGPPECRFDGLEFQASETNPGNSCQYCDPASNLAGWTNQWQGMPCDAGRCLDGVCTPFCVEHGDGTPCGGGQICDAEVCRYGCFIGAVYLAAGTEDPASPCRSCKPDQSTSSWALAPVLTPCGDGGVCGPSGDCAPAPDTCTIWGETVPRGATDPDEPSWCCRPELDPAAWSNRLQYSGSYPAAAPWAAGIAVADFNRDGLPDLAVVAGWGGSSTLSIMLGQATGGFGARIDYPTCNSAWGLAVGDLDGDGFPDLVVAHRDAINNPENGSIAIHRNRGDGTGALEPADIRTFNKTVLGESFPLVDLDGDGILDLALTGGGVYFLKGIGDGGFANLVNQPFADPSELSTSIVAARLRGAGLDLAAAANLDPFLNLFFGNGSGQFVEQPRLSEVPGTGSRTIAAGDFDGDGFVDLVASGSFGLVSSGDYQGLLVYHGHGDGTFDAPTNYPTRSSLGWITLADLDGDGRLEALSADFGSQTWTVFWHTADGGVAPYTQATEFGTDPVVAVGADVNADGVTDVLVGDADGLVNLYVNICP